MANCRIANVFILQITFLKKKARIHCERVVEVEEENVRGKVQEENRRRQSFSTRGGGEEPVLDYSIDDKPQSGRPSQLDIEVLAYKCRSKPIWNHKIAGRAPELGCSQTCGQQAYEQLVIVIPPCPFYMLSMNPEWLEPCCWWISIPVPIETFVTESSCWHPDGGSSLGGLMKFSEWLTFPCPLNTM
ncbi:hypothetical protein NQ318_023548 [Aromia moschata]|uniref:Uncharacterized protein n=1 Tax=Aromia moschata TaxID=1265417 RepID=A0AAV8YNB7_9CUCU|nr:hypothetical protein NQ318_023548 [Aromia moschata]